MNILNHSRHAIKSLAAAAAVSLLSASCQFVGLGDATDLTAPSVAITDPSSMGNISATYTVKGTASDNVGVTSLTMTCSTTGQTWKYTPASGWQYLASSSSSWASAAGTWEGSSESVSWTVTIALAQSASGSDYTLTTTVADAAGNSSSSSKDERVVILDTTPPVVTVTSPLLEPSASDMDSWTSRTDPATIVHLVNGDFSVTGITKDDSTLSGITLHLKSADGASDYYSDKITDTAKTRNWSFSVHASDIKNGSTVLAGRSIIEVYIETTDAAGNEQKLVCGYFCYWPEADTPWLEASFGYSTQAGAESGDKVYPTYKMQGQAYDDDGIKTVTADIYSMNGSDASELSTSPVTLYEASSYTSYVSWSAAAPADNGTYKIVLHVVDKNGTAGMPLTRYFAVQDIHVPLLSVTSPLSGSSAIGDKDGNMTFKGTASDDSTLLTLDVAYIKNGADSLKSQITYLDGSGAAWDKASSGGYTDENSNKVYAIPLSQVSGSSSTLHYYLFEKTFNIFSDFGVSASDTLANQILIFRLSDAENHAVRAWSLTGDIEQPVITLDKITIGGTAYNLKTTSTLPSGISGKTAVLSGTWTDDSIRSWNNKDKIGNVAVSWSDAGVITTSKTWDSSSETGTWTSDSFTMPDVTAATITASITDWGGNTGSAQGSFYVNSNEPQLVRISSTNSDGSYKAGDVITVTTEFNKAMTFSGGSADPVLLLSNGGTAAYSSGNGTSRHLYTYTVQTKEANSSVESADLSVSSFSTNGNIWKDSVGAALNTSASTTLSIPSGSNLADIRTIVIDVTAPAISSIQPVTSGGTYKAGKTLYFRAAMSEDVTIGSGTNPTLTLGGFTGSTRTTAAATVTGTKTLMFSYTTASGDTNTGLTVTAFTAGTASITDAAGNTLSTALPAMSASGLVIDTAVPGVPSIVCAVANGSSTYTAASFTVTYGETGGTKQYSLDGGSSWSSYTSAVSLSGTGTYRITARQTDAAGNTSDTASVYTVTVDSAPLLEYITSTQSDGTYTYHTGTAAGDTIPIMLHFRKNMTVTGTPTLAISTTAGTSAVSYTDGSGSSVLEFDYKVASGDTTSGAALTVTKLNLTDTDCITDGTINVGTYLPSTSTDLNNVSGGNLAANRTIYIQTGNPSCLSVAVSGIDDSAKLIITFDRSIIKNSGNITLTQTSTELAPAVLSATDYATYASYSTETKTVLEKYYTKSTNGSDSGGISDTTAKYVLDYACSADDSALVSALDTAGMFKRTIPVTSSAVTISGSGMTIALTGSYAVPVNGAAYTCVVPAAIVTDSLGNTNTSAKTETGLIAPGVEAPVIRIDKELESITVSGSAPTAVQPLTTACKIDCQTEGASLAYTLTQTTSTTRSLSTYHLPTEAGGTTHVMAKDYDEADSANQTPVTTTGSEGILTDYTRGNTITLGSSADYTTGYTYLIAATATYSSYTAKGYETAYRTVVQIQSRTLSNPAEATSMWLRGGDSSNGSVTTADFPLSWNTSETGKVRCMTSGTNSSLGTIYYWVTWKINTTSYVGFIAGTADTSSATTTSNGTVTAGGGPNKMCWGSCAWVSSKLKYPVYPGRSLYMPTGSFASQILGQQYGNFDFQEKHIITIR